MRVAKFQLKFHKFEVNFSSCCVSSMYVVVDLLPDFGE